MQIFLARPISLLLVALAGTCDSQPTGQGSGSSAGSRTASDGGVSSHEDVVHALEKVTGTSLGASTPPLKKPGKLKPPAKSSGVRTSGGGSQPSPSPAKEELHTRHIGQSCDYTNECASGSCVSGICTLEYNDTLANGEKCSHNSECSSGYCTVDGTCD